MAKIVSAGMVALIGLLSGGFVRAQTGPQAQAPTGVVIGVVVDRSTGSPLADAVVTVTLRTPGAATAAVPQRVITDSAGRFAFTGLPGAGLTIQATKPGHLDASLAVDLRDGERVNNARIPLTRYASISGRVTDDLGDPVVGVSVRAHRRTYTTGQQRLEYGMTTQTDDRGLYRISVLVAGDYVVAVPFSQVTMPIAVMAEYSAPGANANRDLRVDMLRVAYQPAALGTPDARRVGDLVLQSPPGSYYSPDSLDPRRGTAYQTTFAPSTPSATDATTVTLQPGEERTGVNVQLTLVPVTTVSGTVIGPDGPVARAGLRLFPAVGELPDDLNFAPATTMADASGVFTFLNVPAGSYILRGMKSPRADENLPETYALWADQPVTVGDVPLDGVRVAMRRPIRVMGQLRFEGTNPPSAEELVRMTNLQPALGISAIDGAASGGSGRVDASGSFATREVRGGRYLMTSSGFGSWSLKSAMWDGRDITRVPIELKDGDISGVVATFTDRPARISGRVQNAQGAPDETATVLLFPVDATTTVGSWVRRQFQTARVEATGTFAFPPVPAGEYLLIAVAEATEASAAIDVPGLIREWQNPAFLRAVSSAATRVQIADGETVTRELKTVAVR